MSCYLLNKPINVVSHRTDPQPPKNSPARPSVFDLAAALNFPDYGLVGRLDAASSGLMLFTNNGRLQNAICKPLSPGEDEDDDDENEDEDEDEDEDETDEGETNKLLGEGEREGKVVSEAGQEQVEEEENEEVNHNRATLKTKIYEVDMQFTKPAVEEDFDLSILLHALSQPLNFQRFNRRYQTVPAAVEIISCTRHEELSNNHPNLGWVFKIRVRLQEGKHHQIRRMVKIASACNFCRRYGDKITNKLRVIKLHRVSLCGGVLNIDSVPLPGQCRWLTTEEINLLERMAGLA